LRLGFTVNAGVIRWDEDYANAICDERQFTPLGGGTINVEVVGLLSHFDSAPILWIPIPGRWLKDVVVGTHPQCKGVSIMIGNVSMTYTAEGLTLTK
jgi:hypothetical protein